MSLLELPLEILDEIIWLSLPSGIESLALTCKVVYARAAPQIERHNALKRQWRNSVIDSYGPRHSLNALYAIANDPLAAQYIQSFDFWDLNASARDEMGTDDDIGNDPNAMDKIKNMVLSSRPFNLAFTDEWWEGVKGGIREGPDTETSLFPIVTLLSQVPNLTTLRLAPAWEDIDSREDAGSMENNVYVRALDAIVELANNGNNRNMSLSKLETILPFTSEGYEYRVSLQCLQPFMVLKSLRNLYAISCVAVDDGYTGMPFQWRHQDLASPLTKVELAYCCMDSEGLSALVSHTPCLQTFKYSHQTKWHGVQHDWNPGAFIETLSRHCGQSITELAITIDDLYGEIENGASSFLNFPNLEYLEVDVQIFCGPPVESGQRQGMSRILPEGARQWTFTDIPCIGSMLPTSILAVELNTEYPHPDPIALHCLLKDIMPQRRRRLTRLSRVLMRQWQSDSIRLLCEQHEVLLEAFTTQGVPRSFMPRWKREFDQRVGGVTSG
ncbi:hypothetical protein CC78DRAFT_166694 [Lojkania enalia]|uniref:F-box domain-containing protein n=1 Tax=Lojkania enalia TaxID=147567 RepID=A0A9P4K1Q7_9PLEO|nr:hypothetical protein CC78DRAFT_166694 [Didymosphaeria enalia]